MRVLGPEIPLPDPSQPIPANFLRSQIALLGTAGVVSGIKPANLPQTIVPGSTQSHPIIITETDADTTLDLQSNAADSPSPLPSLATLIPSNLPFPRPPTQAIIETLLHHKSVQPLLKEILQLVSEGLPQKTPEFHRPPAKKRKLSSVPAGAADWDVPFPFLPGEGPEGYRGTWARERVKKLVAQLMELVYSATRVAGARLHHGEAGRRTYEIWKATGFEEHPPKPYYRAKTRYSSSSSTTSRSASLPPADAPHASAAPSVGPRLSPSETPVELSTPTEPSPSSLDNLLLSLLAASSNSGTSQVDPPMTRVDEGKVDDWLNLLQSFSVPADNSLFAQNDIPLFDDLAVEASPIHPQEQHLAGVAPPLTLQSLLAETAPPTDLISPGHFKDIDPQFLDLSIPNAAPDAFPPSATSSTPGNPWDLGPLSALGSPMQSMSSFTDPEPMTPLSADWDMSGPEIFSYSGSIAGDATPTLHQHDTFKSQGMWRRAIANNMKAYYTPPIQGGVHDKGKGAEVARSNSVFATSRQSTPLNTRASTPSVTNGPKRSRAEILRAARERRKELAAAVLDTTVSIWETTIEQGVLSHLAQSYR